MYVYMYIIVITRLEDVTAYHHSTEEGPEMQLKVPEKASK